MITHTNIIDLRERRGRDYYAPAPSNTINLDTLFEGRQEPHYRVPLPPDMAVLRGHTEAQIIPNFMREDVRFDKVKFRTIVLRDSDEVVYESYAMMPPHLATTVGTESWDRFQAEREHDGEYLDALERMRTENMLLRRELKIARGEDEGPGVTPPTEASHFDDELFEINGDNT